MAAGFLPAPWRFFSVHGAAPCRPPPGAKRVCSAGKTARKKGVRTAGAEKNRPEACRISTKGLRSAACLWYTACTGKQNCTPCGDGNSWLVHFRIASLATQCLPLAGTETPFLSALAYQLYGRDSYPLRGRQQSNSCHNLSFHMDAIPTPHGDGNAFLIASSSVISETQCPPPTGTETHWRE